MATTIAVGTSSGTAFSVSPDTSGNLAFTTQAGANTISVPNNYLNDGDFSNYSSGQFTLSSNVLDLSSSIVYNVSGIKQNAFVNYSTQFPGNYKFNKNIIIGENISSIDSYAFNSVPDAKNIIFKGNKPGYIDSFAFSGINTNTPIYYD